MNPDIEKNKGCIFDCSIGEDLPSFLEIILEGEELPRYEAIIGSNGLTLLAELNDALDKAVYYGDKKGFSKEPRWLKFIALVEHIHTHIKQSVEKYPL